MKSLSLSTISNLCFLDKDYEEALGCFEGYNLELALSKHFKCSIQDALKKELGENLNVVSIQSPFYGVEGRIFESKKSLCNYMAIASDITLWARNNNIRNIVFGSPKQRFVSSDIENNRAIRFLHFLNEISDSSTFWSIENNPTIYGTNWMTSLEEILGILVSENLSYLKLNLDIGAAVFSKEHSVLNNASLLSKIGHVHLNSIGLKLPNKASYEFLSNLESLGVLQGIEVSLECLNIELDVLLKLLKK